MMKKAVAYNKKSNKWKIKPEHNNHFIILNLHLNFEIVESTFWLNCIKIVFNGATEQWIT
jgi:hypothetical protein